MANVRNILLKIVGDNTDAKRKLGETVTDLRHFDSMSAEARADIKTEGAKAKLAELTAQLARYRQQEPSAKLSIKTAGVLAQIERVEAKLAALDHKDVTVDVDVKRGALDRIGSSLSGALGSVFSAFGSSGGNPIRLFSNLLSEVPPVAQAAGAAIVLALIPAVLALAASLGAAVAGLGALAVALAGALGPAVAVVAVAMAGLVKIFTALHERQTKGAQQAQAVASAQDQVRSSTEQLASAQDNLGQQAVAANQAWKDSVEAVKDSILDVQHAQLGIEQSQLRTKQAQQALKDFRKEVGAGAGANDLFKKFTDVNFRGNPAAIKSALADQGTSLTDDQSLKLQQLILDIKDAKLGERDATDRLHDSNTKLQQDRATEADFAKNGIAAYKPYRDALKQVSAAQRSLASAERSRTGALQDQSKAWDALTPAEKRFADAILLVERRIKRAFGPALTALFGGVADGLKSATAPLNDPKVVKSLQRVGEAIGSVFAAIGEMLAKPEMRDAFVQLADGGAKLIKAFGSKVFIDLFTILVRIAKAALPDLLDLFKDVVKWLDKLTGGTKNGEELRKKIHDLIETTKNWLGLIIDIIGVVFNLGAKFKDAGDTIVTAIRRPRDALKSLSRSLGLTKDDFGSLRSAGRTLRAVFDAVADKAIGPLRTILRGLRDTIRGVVRIVAGILSGDWHEAWKGAKDLVKGVIEDIIGFFGLITAPIRAAGETLGKALWKGIKGAFNGAIGFLKGILNDVIGLINHVIGAINSATPGPIKVLGHTITPGIPDIPPIPALAEGGIAVRDTLARLREAGTDEAILPLRPDVLARLGRAIANASPAAFAGPALAGAAGGRGGVIEMVNHITSPAGTAPDPEFLASQLDQKLRKIGRG